MGRKKNEGEPLDAAKCMADALLELMHEKPYAAIRIVEICERATLARCTFYRYFPDKDALLMRCCKAVFHGLSERLLMEDCRTFHGMSVGFFSFWEKRRDFLSVMQKSDMLGFLSWHFDELMFDVAKQVKPENAEMGAYDFSTKVRYHYFFGMGGFWRMAMRWFTNGCKETPEELAQYVVAYYVESFEMEPDCQYYKVHGTYPYDPCYIKPGNEF